MRNRRLACEPLEQRAMLSVVLHNDVLNLGINDDGSLITEYPSDEVESVGLFFDGVEFLAVGTPLALISVAADGAYYANVAPMAPLTPFQTSVSSSEDALSALVVGTVTPGLDLERTISLDVESSVVRFTVTLINTTVDKTFGNVAFTEGVDPDQGWSLGDVYKTYNDVVDDLPVDGGFVRSYSVKNGSPTLAFGVGSADSRATVSVELWAADPFLTIDSPYDPDGAFADGHLHVAFDFGELAPGDSVTAEYVMVLAGTPGEADDLFLAYAGGGSPNGDPVAVDDSFTVDEDHSLTIAAENLLSNDMDPDGDALAISHIEHTGPGVLEQNPDGTFTYTPDRDFYGIDTFQYEVSDGNGGFDTATVTITVNSVIDPVIDIRPGNGSISFNSNGVLGFAILSTSAEDGDAETFDAASLADASLDSFALGTADGGESVHPIRTILDDVDGDGDLDLLLHFSMRELKETGILTAGSVDLVLTGEFGGPATGPDLLGDARVEVKGSDIQALSLRGHPSGKSHPGGR